MKSSLLPIVMLAAALTVGMGSARAAASPNLLDCNAYAACQSIYLEAHEQSTQGHLSEAVRLYKAAYEVRADPVILFSIARVLHKQGQLSEAALYYQRYLDAPVANPEQKHKARDFLNQLPPPEAKPPATAASPATAPQAQVSVTNAPAASAPTDKPIYKKWWFWTAIGVGAVAVIGVGLGVGLSQKQSQGGFPADVSIVSAKF